jgi:hypothetical protein
MIPHLIFQGIFILGVKLNFLVQFIERLLLASHCFVPRNATHLTAMIILHLIPLTYLFQLK